MPYEEDGDMKLLWKIISGAAVLLAGAGLAWAKDISGDVSANSKEIARREQIIKGAAETAKSNHETIADVEKKIVRIEGKLDNQGEQLDRIEGKLDSLTR